MNWRPTLIGSSLRLRPLVEEDFDDLYVAASDPLIWEQHPDRERHTLERFRVYFRSGIDSEGAVAVLDLETRKMVGSSRFTDHNPEKSSVEVGYTFLTRENWGGERNRELKTLMLSYAFQFVESVYFVVGKTNLRSQRAMAKIGGTFFSDVRTAPVPGDLSTSVVFKIEKPDWVIRATAPLSFDQEKLTTARLSLEPLTEQHAGELWELFRDPELHTFVPFEPLTIDKQRERCCRWETRRSPDGTELWLNWAAREQITGKVIAHFQAGLKQDGVASAGYIVARESQGNGFATEGLKAVFAYLRDRLGAKEVKAWSDTRNEASHRLATRLGMTRVEFVKDADFFKGSTSDEFVFSKVLRP